MNTDQILDTLIATQERLDRIEQDRMEAVAERDEAVAAARRTGTSVQRIAELTGVHRQTIYKVLTRAGFTNP